MFERSLCNTCNISAYNTDEIEDYIPAMLFGMYDGFYLYAPSLNPDTDRYEHSLKNYVYYSELLDEENMSNEELTNETLSTDETTALDETTENTENQ